MRFNRPVAGLLCISFIVQTNAMLTVSKLKPAHLPIQAALIAPKLKPIRSTRLFSSKQEDIAARAQLISAKNGLLGLCNVVLSGLFSYESFLTPLVFYTLPPLISQGSAISSIVSAHLLENREQEAPQYQKTLIAYISHTQKDHTIKNINNIGQQIDVNTERLKCMGLGSTEFNVCQQELAQLELSYANQTNELVNNSRHLLNEINDGTQHLSEKNVLAQCIIWNQNSLALWQGLAEREIFTCMMSSCTSLVGMVWAVFFVMLSHNPEGAIMLAIPGLLSSRLAFVTACYFNDYAARRTKNKINMFKNIIQLCEMHKVHADNHTKN